MRFEKGKSFIAPPKLFKAEKALYFPNVYGYTLANTKKDSDSTPAINGKITLVSVYSSLWAEEQANTFVKEDKNPGLHEILNQNKDAVQRAVIQLEDNSAKALLLRFFTGKMKKQTPQEMWGRYFVVRKGLTDEVKDAIGLLNGQVGYTYLLDAESRIRWAGSGNADPAEVESLNEGLKRLIEDARGEKKAGRATRSGKSGWTVNTNPMRS